MPKSDRKFDLIAFDWDGTLYDSTAIITRSIQRAVVDVGGALPTQQAASYVIGLGLRDALAYAAPDVPQEKYPELARQYHFHYTSQQRELGLFEGVLPMLAELRARNHYLTVATGKSRRGLDDVLRDEKLKGVFDGSRTADETASKPHPMMLNQLMQKFGIEPKRTLMIGDTTHDLEMASNAGCARLGVSYGAHARSNFKAHKPIFIADSVHGLHDWLLKHA